MTKSDPDFQWYDENNPIFSNHCNLPGAKLNNTQVKSSIICEGSIVDADEISNSILGPRTVIKKGTIVRDSYIMGNDFYNPPVFNERLPNDLFIDESCVIVKTIIDRHVHLGKGVQLINKNKLMNYNSDDIYIRDGIIIVTRGTSIPDGFVL